MRMNSVFPAFLFLAWFVRRAAQQASKQASVITWKISTRDPGIILL